MMGLRFAGVLRLASFFVPPGAGFVLRAFFIFFIAPC